MNDWSGAAVGKARTYMSIQPLPWTCGQCKEEIKPTQEWVVGHIKPRALFPELTFDISNWQHEHRTCSNKSGNAVKAQKALFSQTGIREDPASTSISLSGTESREKFVPDELTWKAFVDNHPIWLNDIVEVPENSSPPLAMTPVHKETTGTYGPMAEKWILETLKIELRWWQRLVLYRQLEHKADGSLCWEQVIESAPRRSGKSVSLAAKVLWRMQHADLLGEPQQVVHTAMNMRIAKEIQRTWWRWAEDKDWTVRKANGSEEIEDLDGNRWLLLPQGGITGYSPGFAVVDECWDVQPLTISENLEPALMDRMSPQMLLTSTAHSKATSLMRNKIGSALGKNPDPDTLLLLWGAEPTDDIHDRAVWLKASPYHSESRTKIMTRKYLSALDGESDPDFDDMEPMEGFKAQYLNIWPLSDKKLMKGEVLIEQDDWSALEVKEPSAPPMAVAIESAFGSDAGLSVAFAWETGVKVQQVEDAPAAEALIRASGFKGRALAGGSLMGDPAFVGRAFESKAMAVSVAVQEFGRLLNEKAIKQIPSDLTEQVLNIRLERTAGGIRLISKDRTDGIKAAVWAMSKVRTKRRVPKSQVITSRTVLD